MPIMYSGGAGNIASAQITDGTIINDDINVAAAIDWGKISKVGASVDDLAQSEVMKTAEISISSAEILALFTTPKTLVAAPAAGKAIILENVSFSFTHGGVNYAAGGAWRIQYNGQTTNLLSTMNIDSPINGAASFLRHYTTAVAAGGNTPFAATALEITNATANHTTGNGTLKVYVKYKIITL